MERMGLFNVRLRGMGLQEGKLKSITFIWVILIITLLVFFSGLFVGKRFLCSDSVQYDTTYIYDTAIYEIPVEIPVADTIYIGKPYPVDVINYDTIIDTDTVFIMADYSAERVYYDTIQDAKLTAYLHERVQFNRITHREFGYKITAPTAQITNHYNKHHIYGKMRIYGNSKDAGFAFSVDYANDRIIAGLGYDFTRNYVFVEAGIPIMQW
jgi:hypothetical protein